MKTPATQGDILSLCIIGLAAFAFLLCIISRDEMDCKKRLDAIEQRLTPSLPEQPEETEMPR